MDLTGTESPMGRTATDLRERPGTDEYAPHYGTYVDRVPDGPVVDLLTRQLDETLALLRAVPEGDAASSYAAGKWSIKEVVGHITDTERVFAYRALRFARGDATPLPGFEQDPYVDAGAFDRRSLAGLLDELADVRRATVSLLAGLPADAWLCRGTASGHPVTVRALAYMIAGHELHHRAILAERYLPHLGRTRKATGQDPATA